MCSWVAQVACRPCFLTRLRSSNHCVIDLMMTFLQWLARINSILRAKHGFDIEGLPDEPFYDYYDDNLTPDQVVDIMIQNNMCLVE